MLTLPDLQTPALLIRLDRVRHNLRRMTELLLPHGGLERWRPHVKTCKVPAVLDLLLAGGLRRFKCATGREAAVLLQRADAAGVAIDLLVAFAHRGANLRRIAQLARANPRHRVALLSEDPEHARDAREQQLGVFVDLDPGWHRSGIPLAEHDRIRATVASAHDRFAGLHCYEGHLRDGDPAARAAAAAPIHAELRRTVDALRLDGAELITSGTPGFPAALVDPAFAGLDHRISPGTVVYWDLASEELGIRGFLPAALVLARVASAPCAGRLTLDAGSKALDAAAGGTWAAVEGWPGLEVLHPS
jgi:D-serine deaminase-like pyridoxal phosphate-dependent protein